jgi:hypothetical protein
MTDEEIQKWASAYIEAQQDPNLLKTDHPQWWAVEKFMNVGTEEVTATDCFKAILAVLAMDPPENVIGVLAAGPLEDLIEECGEEVIEDIEREARQNPAFKHLLGGVWKSGTPEVWSRVQACRGEAC